MFIRIHGISLQSRRIRCDIRNAKCVLLGERYITDYTGGRLGVSEFSSYLCKDDIKLAIKHGVI